MASIQRQAVIIPWRNETHLTLILSEVFGSNQTYQHAMTIKISPNYVGLGLTKTMQCCMKWDNYLQSMKISRHFFYNLCRWTIGTKLTHFLSVSGHRRSSPQHQRMTWETIWNGKRNAILRFSKDLKSRVPFWQVDKSCLIENKDRILSCGRPISFNDDLKLQHDRFFLAVHHRWLDFEKAMFCLVNLMFQPWEKTDPSSNYPH